MISKPLFIFLTEAGSKEWEQLTRATRGRVEGLQRGLQTKLTSSQDQALWQIRYDMIW